MNPLDQIAEYLNDQIKTVFKCPATYYGIAEQASKGERSFPVCKEGNFSKAIEFTNLKPFQIFHRVTGAVSFDEPDDEESYGLEVRSRFEAPMQLVGIGQTGLVSKSCGISGRDLAFSIMDGLPGTPVDVSDNLKAMHLEGVELDAGNTVDIIDNNFTGIDYDRVSVKLFAFSIAYTAVGYKCERFCIDVPTT